MSGPVETELPPTAFRRRDKLRLSLQRTISEPEDLKSRLRSMNADELARKIITSNNKHHLPFLLLDCRGYLCYSDSHIRGAVHIACTDRFNRKRVQNSGSVLDLVSTNNRRNKPSPNGSASGAQQHGLTASGKWRDVVVYDEGTSDLSLDSGDWQSPISFVLSHLLQENRQPIYLNGGIREFTRYYRDLCDTCTTNRKDLSIMTSATSPSFFPPSPLLSPLSPAVATPSGIDSYENEPPTQVLPFLYVGNAKDSKDKELLKKLKIRYILSVTTTPSYLQGNNSVPTTTSTTTSMCSSTSSTVTSSSISSSMSEDDVLMEDEEEEEELHTKLIPVSDNLCENLAPYFDDACEFIEEARKSGSVILIHCQAGISRSPTIAIAYIMKHINLSTLDAYAFVQNSRRIISPNLNFMGQLVEFESKLKGLASHSSSESESSTESISSVDSTGSNVSVNVTPMIITD